MEVSKILIEKIVKNKYQAKFTISTETLKNVETTVAGDSIDHLKEKVAKFLDMKVEELEFEIAA